MTIRYDGTDYKITIPAGFIRVVSGESIQGDLFLDVRKLPSVAWRDDLVAGNDWAEYWVLIRSAK